jgi:GlpG protein
MRLIGTLAEEGKYEPLAFAYFLKNRGIDNELELLDPSESEGTTYRIWIVEEDQVEEATRLYNQYKQEPGHNRYKQPSSMNKTHTKSKFPPLNPKNAFAPLSTLILILTIGIFMWVRLQDTPNILPSIKGVFEAPFFTSAEKLFLYDYPKYFELRDTLFKEWTPKDIAEKKKPSSAALATLEELQKTNVWMGIYQRIFVHKENPSIPLQYTGPIFEKISQGEIWRLLTPAFLHHDLLHIFFNLLWFVILSNQIEIRIGLFRTLLFIVSTGIISNTAQYLVSGPFFMGLSGVICAMAAFIWARQQKAPWEGYLVHRLTLLFLGIFILGMFALSFFFFLTNFFNNTTLSMPIANTAHISGAVMGYLLGRTSLFTSHL